MMVVVVHPMRCVWTLSAHMLGFEQDEMRWGQLIPSWLVESA
jgi:hypothetical protein